MCISNYEKRKERGHGVRGSSLRLQNPNLQSKSGFFCWPEKPSCLCQGVLLLVSAALEIEYAMRSFTWIVDEETSGIHLVKTHVPRKGRRPVGLVSAALQIECAVVSMKTLLLRKELGSHFVEKIPSLERTRSPVSGSY